VEDLPHRLLGRLDPGVIEQRVLLEQGFRDRPRMWIESDDHHGRLAAALGKRSSSPIAATHLGGELAHLIRIRLRDVGKDKSFTTQGVDEQVDLALFHDPLPGKAGVPTTIRLAAGERLSTSYSIGVEGL
jgi:hypothetical protein